MTQNGELDKLMHFSGGYNHNLVEHIEHDHNHAEARTFNVT